MFDPEKVTEVEKKLKRVLRRWDITTEHELAQMIAAELDDLCFMRPTLILTSRARGVKVYIGNFGTDVQAIVSVADMEVSS